MNRTHKFEAVTTGLGFGGLWVVTLVTGIALERLDPSWPLLVGISLILAAMWAANNMYVAWWRDLANACREHWIQSVDELMKECFKQTEEARRYRQLYYGLMPSYGPVKEKKMEEPN